MYDKLLKELEDKIKQHGQHTLKLSSILDNIIKIKTIQAMDTSAELIQASRRVSRN